MGFNKDGALVGSSGMNTQQSVWLMTQVPPCKELITSEVILLWRAAFLIGHVSVFCKDRFRRLSFKACVNLVRASMCAVTSSRPMEGEKMAAK